jgi:hypothetical protein
VGASGRCRVSYVKRSPRAHFNTSRITGYCCPIEWGHCWRAAFQYNRCLVSGVPLLKWNDSFKRYYTHSLAYVYCVRSFGVPTLTSLPLHDQQTCQGLVAKLVPFLTDRSTLMLQNVSEARSFVQYRLNDQVRSPLFRMRELSCIGSYLYGCYPMCL